MKNGKQNIEDYLTEKDFIRWVKNPDGPQKVFWQAWMASNPDEKEKILKAREIILSMKVKEFDLHAEDYEEVMDRLLTRGENYVRPIGYRHWDSTADYGIFWRVAAILVLAFSLSFVIYSINMKPGHNGLANKGIGFYKTTDAKQKSHFNLPDGTLVWLNRGSQLIYDNENSDAIRQVYLEGEAFFEVAKDVERPFLVKTGNMIVKALGTSFNVNTIADAKEVALVSGTVQVWIESLKDKDVLLQPGERAVKRVGSFELEVSSFNAMEVAGWKEGILHFQEATFADVKKRLEYWYNVKLIIEGMPQSDWNYSGTFMESSLERVLDRISYTKGFVFTIKDDVVQIKF
jgi:transmembrane sensor